tara:strand:- start:877 stop:1455 length:579 start_codon:yes stop_codon:yes gene_type:complete
MISGLGAVITGLVALWALLVAYPDWKKRETYKARSADARSILSAFYEGRQVIDSIRSPLTYGHEIDEAQKIIDDAPELRYLPEEVRRRHRQRIVTRSRANRHAEFWEKAFRLLPVAKAVFGDQVEAGLLTVIQARQSVFAAVDVYPDVDDEFRPWQEKFWKGIGKPDPIDADLDVGENKLREHLAEYLHIKT